MPVALPTHEELGRAVAALGVRGRRLLTAFSEVPRAGFVPPAFVGRAYVDEPLPIPHQQVTTQPSLVAKMVEGLRLEGAEKVLEIGTGFGFQTAILARLAGFVWSVERWADLAEVARRNLVRHLTRNAEIVVGDGSEGLPDQAPFDAILMSAAFPRVPAPVADQLSPGGALVQPIGSGGNEDVILFTKRCGRLVRRRTITGARFVRLWGTHGFRPGDSSDDGSGSHAR
jgi:protein-L-isoaspartate(D-aspartate) O-methyltransferase